MYPKLFIPIIILIHCMLCYEIFYLFFFNFNNTLCTVLWHILSLMVGHPCLIVQSPTLVSFLTSCRWVSVRWTSSLACWHSELKCLPEVHSESILCFGSSITCVPMPKELKYIFHCENSYEHAQVWAWSVTIFVFYWKINNLRALIWLPTICITRCSS